jgi:hypothetical protein
MIVKQRSLVQSRMADQMFHDPMNPSGASALDRRIWVADHARDHSKMETPNVCIQYRAGGIAVVGIAMSWSGGGVINTSDGTQEQLRCRASYDVGGTGSDLRLSLRCASDSYTFDLASEVQYRGGVISGSWNETSRNASGTISGRAAGGRIEASARGDAFSANLSLTTRGNRQTVSIRPQGTSITAVSLALDRR